MNDKFIKYTVFVYLFFLLLRAMDCHANENSTSSDIVINEVMVSNVDEWISPSWNFDGWIELYNPTSSAIDVGGLFFSNDIQNLKLWQAPSSMGKIPAHGYLLVWFDEDMLSSNSVPFKLDVDGGTVYISDANGQLIASQTYPEGIERASYARTTDGGSVWNYTSTPTPGKANSLATYANSQLPSPIVDQPSQLFTGTLYINVGIPSGTVLRYTTDGTLPTLTNGKTAASGKFSLTKSTVLRFRLFSDNYLASRTITRSYLYNDKDYTLPIVSIVVDPVFLYDDSIGIYVKGVNGVAGNGQTTPCNWNMDWERPGNFSYIIDNDMVLNQDVNLKIAGGYSRAWTPRSLKLKGSKELGGNKNLPYPFFSSKPYIRNRTLQVRNGGNDVNCRLKDMAIHTMVMSSGIDIDCQSAQPCHEFINGQYIGMLNIREPNNKHYVYANYGWDDDEIDQFEIGSSTYLQQCGTPDKFEQLYSLSSDAADPDTYKEIKNILDVDEYANYMAEELYLGVNDWPLNNLKGFRHSQNGKFRIISYDVDLAFSIDDVFNKMMSRQVISGVEQKFISIFSNLLNNDEFRKRFIDTYCIMGGSVFLPERCNAIIDSITAITRPALSLEGKSPDNTAEEMKEAFANRMPLMTYYLKSFSPMGLTNTASYHAVLGSNIQGADIMLNEQKIPTGQFNGRLFPSVTVSAVCPAGYKFVGWKDGMAKERVIFSFGDSWSYYDKGSLDGKSWTSSSYNSSSWSTGKTPLGYGFSSIGTTISYGSNASSKIPTYYFRKSFQIDKEPDDHSLFVLDCKADDGFIVYVNGTEAGRYLMTTGTVAYSTYSKSYAHDNPDNTVIVLPSSLFHKGSNVIAVEVHNSSASSSDIYWDARLIGTLDDESAVYYSTETEITLPDTNCHLTACYEELSNAEMAMSSTKPVMINEVSGNNSIYVNEYYKKNDWVELYNSTNSPIDVEGMYLSDNISVPTKYKISKEGTMAVTVIPAHGHLIVWCDKLATTDQGLHATFKIDGDGGIISLTAADRSWSDTLQYCVHDGNSTVGRYPDGGKNIYLMDVPTIGKTNQLSSYDVNQYLIGDVNEDGIVNITDGVCLLNCILQSKTNLLNMKVADVNCDGFINITDVIMINSMILSANN